MAAKDSVANQDQASFVRLEANAILKGNKRSLTSADPLMRHEMLRVALIRCEDAER